MTDIPIIFSAAMVQALLGGHKTMTRRLAWREKKAADGPEFHQTTWRRVMPGDRLWVRESLYRDRMASLLTGDRTTNAMVAYYSADHEDCVDNVGFNMSWIWKRRNLPSIHMPRPFSRLTLVVTASKVEPLQCISENDAKAEGIGEPYLGDADPPFQDSGAMISRRQQFRNLWDSLHGDGAWSENPDVVALTFEVHKRNIDSV